jgi:zinc/manganese transport system permease protein
MSWEAWNISLIGPAFAAGLLILVTHVPLGRQVLARGIVFLDLTVAQLAALGVIAAHFAGVETGWLVQVFAVAAAATGAVALHFAEKRWPETQEALIGSAFVVSACMAILLLAHDPHGGEALHDLLAGQILWVSSQQLRAATVITVALGAILLTSFARRGFGFYLLFACAVTLSVQLAGVYLVFASLILPALAVRRLPGFPGLLAGWGIGLLGYASGLVLSALFDLPSAAIVVCALALIALLFVAGFMPLLRMGEAPRERLGLK